MRARKGNFVLWKGLSDCRNDLEENLFEVKFLCVGYNLLAVKGVRTEVMS